MESGCYRFGRFILDLHERRLSVDGAPVDLSGRYLDALHLLVREQGRLVSKERFLAEVWRGVPVTDEALTQCVRTLRRQLGDEAARPRFIETIPKHGYRFIAPVDALPREGSGPEEAAGVPQVVGGERRTSRSWHDLFRSAGAATAGGAAAGFLGGLFYGLVGASQPLLPGLGAVSVLLVLVCLTLVLATLGAAGVGFGMALATQMAGRRSSWIILGGATGGLVIGAFVKLLSLDAFGLLLGRSPGDVTGAPEGALLGGAVGLGIWLGDRRRLSLRRRVAITAATCGAAGMVITLLGGRLLAGSLDLVARAFPESHLRLDQIGGIFGERGLGPVGHIVTGGLEGLLFGGCIMAAIALVSQEPIPTVPAGNRRGEG